MHLIQKISDLAPLHNPPSLKLIKICLQKFKKAAHLMCFDTMFHSSISPSVFSYALPLQLCQKLKIRKYGFHGLSHENMSRRVINKNLDPTKLQQTRIISLHLGSGSSCCAVQNGKSIECSMGYTPLEGLIMGSRSGDVDPSAGISRITIIVNGFFRSLFTSTRQLFMYFKMNYNKQKN